MTVDPLAGDFDPSPMIPYLAELGVEYHYVRKPIMELAKEHMGRKSYCAFCSRLKRGFMYQTARDNGFNVIALAQHLDDLAESFLLSAFHGGKLKTMKAHYVNDDGDLRIIRPLVYVRERQTRDFAHDNSLPVIADSCPACFSMPTQRQHMKELLAAEEGSSGDAGSGQSSGQETADTGKPDHGKKSAKPEDTAKPEDKEPECD